MSLSLEVRDLQTSCQSPSRHNVEKDAASDTLDKTGTSQKQIDRRVVPELKVKVGRVAGCIGQTVHEDVEVDRAERRAERGGKAIAKGVAHQEVELVLCQAVGSDVRSGQLITLR